MADTGAGTADVEFDPAFGKLWVGPMRLFADWPHPEVPDRGGVYTIWDVATGTFVYVGIATDKVSRGRSRSGLRRRLHQHAKGDRSGDRFCIYVQDRFVLPGLTTEEIASVARGAQSLDGHVRTYVRSRLGYRFVVAADGMARRIELRLRLGDWPAGPPVLNPALPVVGSSA